MSTLTRQVSVPHGATITCKEWSQEPALCDLRDRLRVTARLGGMRGAQPLGVTMHGGVAPVSVEVKEAFRISGFVPEYIRPLFCEGDGPFGWTALSCAPTSIATTDDFALELFEDADGSRQADDKLERVLTCDPGIGAVRDADAGYPKRSPLRHARTLTC